MQRVNVRGPTGSGKTTTSRRLAERLGVPHIELDALHWEPNWANPPAERFISRVEAALDAAPSGWVVDGNYGSTLGDLVLERADTVVWLDMPLRICFRRIWRRTWRRILTRELIWGTNRDSIRNAFFRRDALFVWLLQTHGPFRRNFPERLARHPHLRVIHLRTPRDVEQFLA